MKNISKSSGCEIEKISYYNGINGVENGIYWSTVIMQEYYSELININKTLISIKPTINGY